MLTMLETRVLGAIREHINSNGVSPTISEIAESLELRSRGTVHRYVQSLIRKGELVREGTGWRGLKLAVPADPNIALSTPAPADSPVSSTSESPSNVASSNVASSNVVSTNVVSIESGTSEAVTPNSSAPGQLGKMAAAGTVPGAVPGAAQVAPQVATQVAAQVATQGAADAAAEKATGWLGNVIPPGDGFSGLGGGVTDAIKDFADSLRIPLLGSVAAGMPIEAIPDESHLDLAAFFIGPDKYALRVTGDSMIDAGIMDGDTVILRNQSTARSGDIVVALIDGQEATLKRLGIYTSDIVELIPENSAMSRMRYNPARVAIQGVLIGQLRSY